MLKIRRPQDRLIFNMGVPILVRRHLYIETTPRCHMICVYHIDGSVQDCTNSSTLAMELQQSCTKPSISTGWSSKTGGRSSANMVINLTDFGKFRCTVEAFKNHWSRVTHICVSKIIIIGSDSALSPGRHQAIIWTNAGISIIGPVGINFDGILIKTVTISFNKMYLKMSSEKWRLFRLGLSEFHYTLWTPNRVLVASYFRG